MGKRWTKKELDILKNNYSNLSFEKLGSLLPNRTKHAIKKTANNLNIQRHKIYPLWTNEEYDILKSYYHHLGPNDIQKYLPGRTKESILKQTKKLKIKCHSKFKCRTHFYNMEYFRTPNLDNCYFAGFISADGCIFGNQLKLYLGGYDKIILENFKAQLNHPGPIKEEIRKTPYSKGKNYKYCCFYAISPQIVTDLKTNWNITNKKTFTLEPPTNLSLEQSLAYIIGNFDGDGCWMNAKNVFCMRFLGTKNLLSWIKDIIDKILPPINYINNINVLKYKNIFSLSMQGRRARDLHKLLLDVPLKFRLPRKWNEEELIKYREYRKNRILTHV